jgi:predicted O-methyltransferase YrrM
MNALQDPKALAVLSRLEALNAKQEPRILRHVLPRWIAQRLRGRTYEVMDDDFFRDKLVALDPDKCRLIHLLCRSLGARRVVEVGTSFGVSTIYLAAAVRDQVGVDGDGLVIGTEIEPSKVAAARAHIAEAGLSRFVDVREGDVLQTLQQVPGPVDFVLLDIWTPLALPALRLLVPQLRKGAIVVCDFVVQAKREYADYLAYVRDPANGFESATLPYRGGLELSVRTA